MAGLQVLEDTFSGQGFHVLGFLSNDFGNQGGSDGDIGACNAKYGITFLQFAIDHVIPSGAATPEPVFAWIESRPNPGPSTTTQPTWNFHKWLISRHGDLVAHWDSVVYPGDDPLDTADSFDTSAIVVAI